MSSRGTRRLFWLMLLLAIVGAGARALQLWRNDSLILDECAVCLNIAERGLRRSAETPYYNQAAPLGFLALQKAVFKLAGMTDVTVRVVPFLAGLATIPLAIALGYLLFDPASSPFALALAIGLVCVNRAIIDYSATAKQYTLEAAVTLVSLCTLAACLGAEDAPHGSAKARAFLIVSPALMWFSYGAVLIDGAIAAVLIARAAALRSRAAVQLALFYALAALAMLAPFYFLSMRPATSNAELIAQWSKAYLPLWPPGAALAWLYERFVLAGEMVIHLRLALILPIALLVVAADALRRRAWFWLAASGSVALCLMASALRRYPFDSRLLIFLVPVFAFICARVVQLVEERSRFAAALATAAMLGAATLTLFIHGIAVDHPIDDVRAPFRAMAAALKPGDRVLVAWLAVPCFRYYAQQYPLPDGVTVDLLARDAKPALPAGRDWVFVMRTPWQPGEGEALLAEGAADGVQQAASFDEQWTTARLFVRAAPR
jgi:hypothetical protein